MNDTQKKIVADFLATTTLENSTTEETVAATLNFPAVSDGETIKLPEPDLLPDANINFLETVELRSTVRKYSSTPLTQKELSYLLWCTQGVKALLPNGMTKRTVPSAGGQHVLTTFLYIQNAENISPGLYRFLPAEHALTLVTAKDECEEKFTAAFKNRALIKGSAVTFAWVADAGRMTARFGARGCRYVWLDAGHVCQNLYLAGHTMGIGVCAVGAFSDERLTAALNVPNDENCFVAYCATAGKM